METLRRMGKNAKPYTAMLKTFLQVFILLLLVNPWASAQDNTETFLTRRAKQANLIVEGKVIEQSSFWNEDQTFIFTKNLIKVKRVLKGNVIGETVELITPGGKVGKRFIKTSELAIASGNSGIFFSEKKEKGDYHLQIGGYVKYDQFQKIAVTKSLLFKDIEKELIEPILQETGNAYVVDANVEVFTQRNTANNQRTEAVEISSFVPMTATAGTQTKLTINGTGFGDRRGSGQVIFTGSENGGSTTYPLFNSGDYISWNDTKIEVYVPHLAGTGTLIVQNDTGESFESFDKLTVPYAIHNEYSFEFTGPFEQETSAGIIPYLTGQNNDGGYTLFVDPEFYQTERFLNPLVSALNSWRCSTGVNIRLAANQGPIDFFVSGKSAISIIEDQFFNDSFSFGEYEECDTGTEKIFRLRHFRMFLSVNNTSWNFEGNPSFDEKDFETEIRRLLGKMSLLENVNDPNDLMYYQAPFGATRSIGNINLEAADLVVSRSADVPTDCEWTGHRFLLTAECLNSLSPVEARFTSDKTVFCNPGETVAFTSTSRNASSLFWEFEGGDITSSTDERVKVTYQESGTYTVKLTARNPAGEDIEEKIGFITVGAGDNALTVNLGEDRTICQGETLTLSAIGDALPEPANSTYEWSNGATTSAIEITQAGTYSVTVTSAGCTATDEVVISFVEGAEVDAGPSITACGGDPVKLEATFIEGATYQWSPVEGLSDPTIFNPIASPDETTIYTVTVNTGDFCGDVKDSLRVSIGNPPELFGFPQEDSLELCGELGFLDAFSNDPSAQYEWSNGERNGFIQLFEPGEYWVKVTGSNGCITRDTVHVTFVEEIDLKITGDSIVCSGEPFQLQATGGQFYQWEPFELFEGFGSEVTARVRETTEITVTAFSGVCDPVSKTMTIEAIDFPFLDLSEEDTIVVTEEESFTLSNRYEFANYEWSTGDTTNSITVNESGLYKVTMTPTFCGEEPLTDSVLIYFPNKVQYTLGEDRVVCEENSILTPFPTPFLQESIVWSTGETTDSITVTENGNYTVSITDVFGNVFTDSVKLTFAKLETPFAQDSLFSCGDPIILDALNKDFATYEWSTGATTNTIEVTESGTYAVKITSQCGDTIEDEVVVEFLENKLAVDLGSDTLTLCSLPYTLKAWNPGNAYLWSDGSTLDSLVVQEAGTYTLTVTDSCGNQATDSITLILHETKPIDLGGPVITACQAPVVLDAGTSGMTYAWSDGSESQTLEVHQSGEYSVIVTDSCGFEQTASVEVIIHKTTLDIGPETLNVCSGPVVLDATLANAQSYLWSDGSTEPMFSVNEAGTYNVLVTDSCGFEQTDQITLIFENPSLNLGEDIVACDTEIVLDAGNQGGTFLWSDGSTGQTLTVTESGTYFVEVTPLNCEILLRDSIIVTFPITTVELGTDTLKTCANSIALDAGVQEGSMLWSDGSTNQTLQVTANGTYSVTVTDVCGKEVTDTIVVILNDTQQLELGAAPALICADNFALDAGVFENYEWSDGSTERTLTATNDGVYSVTVTDACGNTQTDEVELKFFKNSMINFSETFIGEGAFQFENLSMLNFESNFHWDFGDGNTSTEENPLHTYQRIGEYTVTLSVGSATCADSLSFQKTVSVIIAGIEPDVFSKSIEVYPNPTANGKTFIAWEINEQLEISLVDAIGRTLQSSSFTEADSETSFDISKYPSGIYYIRFVSDQNQTIKKLIKN